MRKVNVTISYDEEKLKALRWYLQQKGVQLEDELIQAVETMFSKNVPASVRSYITREPEAGGDRETPKPQRKNPASKEVTDNV